ncbi:MAG: PAS domain-containing protein [Candidatus Competibacter sp.]|nr:PAS domain-containing protein [Candidatus Competibacter sp.]
MKPDRLLARAGRPPLTVAEIGRRVHELHVHQIALESHDRALAETCAQIEGGLEKYVDFNDLTPVGYFMLVADGAIREANPAGAALLGQERSRLIDQRLEAFVSEETLPTFHIFLDKVWVGASRETCEVAFAPTGAPCRYVRLDGVGVTSAAGRACQLAAVDITARRRAKAALRQSEILIEGTLDSLTAHVAILDAQGMIILVNAAWRRFAEQNGGGAGCHVGADYMVVCRKVLTGKDRAEAQAALRGICHVLDGTRNYFSMEYPCHSPTEPRWFEMRVFHLNGARPSVMIAHENITARKRTEAALWCSQAQARTLLLKMGRPTRRGYWELSADRFKGFGGLTVTGSPHEVD